MKREIIFAIDVSSDGKNCAKCCFLLKNGVCKLFGATLHANPTGGTLRCALCTSLDSYSAVGNYLDE